MKQMGIATTLSINVYGNSGNIVGPYSRVSYWLAQNEVANESEIVILSPAPPPPPPSRYARKNMLEQFPVQKHAKSITKFYVSGLAISFLSTAMKL